MSCKLVMSTLPAVVRCLMWILPRTRLLEAAPRAETEEEKNRSYRWLAVGVWCSVRSAAPGNLRNDSSGPGTAAARGPPFTAQERTNWGKHRASGTGIARPTLKPADDPLIVKLLHRCSFCCVLAKDPTSMILCSGSLPAIFSPVVSLAKPAQLEHVMSLGGTTRHSFFPNTRLLGFLPFCRIRRPSIVAFRSFFFFVNVSLFYAFDLNPGFRPNLRPACQRTVKAIYGGSSKVY